MAKIYAMLIKAGRKSLEDVPSEFKNEVESILANEAGQ